MKQRPETPITFEDSHEDSYEDRYARERGKDGTMPFRGTPDELDWLMSLALDKALDAQEVERLDELVHQEPRNLDRWAAWQEMDTLFHQMPVALPPPDFGEKFTQRLEIHERRRRLRTGFIFGLAAVALWGSALTGFVMVGALMWSNQDVWPGGVIQNITLWSVALQQFAQALLNTGEALMAAPQMRALLVCYLMIVAAILSGWFALLRRSTRELPLTEAQLAEA